MPQSFEMRPQGPFDLTKQRGHFGGWPVFEPEPSALAMAFAVEGWQASAVVVMRQSQPGGTVSGEVHGCDAALAQTAWEQALAVLSLDIDGRGFPAVGDRDPVVGRLQEQHGFLRPVLFHSPYEAACHFVIGQRISMAQARALRLRIASDSGDRITARGVGLSAFPRPQQLLRLSTVRGLNPEKLTRLHGIARAAIDGLLDRARLRALPASTALAELSDLRGVGPFSSQGILVRGAGLVDEVTDDDVTKEAVQRLYDLDHRPGQAEVERIAQAWRPFRTWAQVLLHVWLRGDAGGPAPRRRGPRGDRPG